MSKIETTLIGKQSEDTNNSDILKPNFDFEKAGIGKAEIVKEVDKLVTEVNRIDENTGLFSVKTANQWLEQAKNRPKPKMLFDAFWYEGEVCILFADTNVGKSILAVQIADSISNGFNISGLQLEATKQKIIYYDFELSDKQFENRYSFNYQEHYSFDTNFIRIEINSDADVPEKQTFEDFLNYSLEQSIINTGAQVLIIDNLTYLRTETERAKDALPLMKQLKALKNKYNLSLLILAHTPKRDQSKPITRNDLQGSKMLINFCDSAFTIGENYNDKNLRYLKQIKQRNTEQIYDTDNVCLFQISKPHNFLQFEYIGFGNEQDYLKHYSEKDKENLEVQIKELHQQGKSFREIGTALGISHMKASRILKKLE